MQYDVSKLKLKKMKQLSRNEMKNVMGGVATATCTYTMAPGYSAQGGSCSGTASECQAAADKWCWSNDKCENVDCR